MAACYQGLSRDLDNGTINPGRLFLADVDDALTAGRANRIAKLIKQT